MGKPRETPVDNPVKPHDAAERCNENVTAPVAALEQKLYTGKVNKNAPDQVLPTPNQELTTSNESAKEGLDMSISKIPEWIADENIAIQFLEFAAKDFQNAKDMRIFYAQAARAHGVTLQQIADIYEMTTSGVHLMLKRAEQTDAADADLIDHDSLIYSTAYDSGFAAGRAFEQQQRDAQ